MTVQDDVLTITGERTFEKEEKGRKYHRVERAYGRFARSFTLPEDADGSKAAAEFNDGVLKGQLALSASSSTLWLQRDRPAGRQGMSDELMTKVQELIDTSINPAVAGHGGFVQLVDVKDNKVYLQMGGGCQGCGAADITLKAGIERMIKEEIPEIEEVLDTTDHAAGENPYYTPGK